MDAVSTAADCDFVAAFANQADACIDRHGLIVGAAKHDDGIARIADVDRRLDRREGARRAGRVDDAHDLIVENDRLDADQRFDIPLDGSSNLAGKHHISGHIEGYVVIGHVAGKRNGIEPRPAIENVGAAGRKPVAGIDDDHVIAISGLDHVRSGPCEDRVGCGGSIKIVVAIRSKNISHDAPLVDIYCSELFRVTHPAQRDTSGALSNSPILRGDPCGFQNTPLFQSLMALVTLSTDSVFYSLINEMLGIVNVKVNDDLDETA